MRKPLVIALIVVAVVVGLYVFRDEILHLIYPDAGQIEDVELALPPFEHLEGEGEISSVVVQQVAVEDPGDPRTLLFSYDTSAYVGDDIVISDATGIGHVGIFTSVALPDGSVVAWSPDVISRIDWTGTVVLLYHATGEPDEGVNVYRIVLSKPLLP